MLSRLSKQNEIWLVKKSGERNLFEIVGQEVLLTYEEEDCLKWCQVSRKTAAYQTGAA
jgi:hypothetical protein